MKCKLEFDFKEGKQVSQKEITKWHRDAVERLKNNPGQQVATTRSGNSMVIALRTGEHNDEITVYEINSGYKEFTYDNH